MKGLMKIVIIAAIILSSAGPCNAQTIPTTPNLGLQLIPDGYTNWGVSYRTTMNTLDSKVAPLASPHFTGTATAVNLTVTGICTGCGGGAGSVSSVFGRTGAVVAATGDYSFSQISGLMNFASQGTGLVPVVNGGTGTASPGLVQGTNVTITGTWPNQTINATASAQVYPGAGVANSTGSAWGSSYSASNLIPANFISTLNQNTTGTAANLSGTPALPNGTTATTQTVGDNSTKLATTAFVLANGSAYTLPQATTSVLGGVKPDGTTCTTSSGVLTCPGTGGISGLTTGYIPLATSATTIGNSLLDYGVTTASTFTFGAPIAVNSSGASQLAFTYNATPLVPGSSTTAVYGVNASGQAVASEAGAAASRVCTAANGVCTAGSVTFPWSCQPGLGDGLNAITSGTYLQTSCYNDTGQTVTLTGIKCYADAGTPTMNVTNGAGTGLLTGAVTCTTSFAAGTQSATTTIAAGDYLKFTFVAGGTAKQSTFVVTGTHP